MSDWLTPCRSADKLATGARRHSQQECEVQANDGNGLSKTRCFQKSCLEARLFSLPISMPILLWGHVSLNGRLTRCIASRHASLANMVPQSPVNNSKTWAGLEKATRSYAQRAKSDIYVITGPVFMPNSCPFVMAAKRVLVEQHRAIPVAIHKSFSERLILPGLWLRAVTTQTHAPSAPVWRFRVICSSLFTTRLPNVHGPTGWRIPIGPE